VLHIREPLDKNGYCVGHPDGCGTHLTIGSLVKVDGSVCQFVGGLWWTSVVRLNSDGYRTCYVGVTKTFFNELGLVCNRVGTISEIVYYEDEGKIKVTVNARGTHRSPVVKNSKDARVAKAPSTLDMARECHGYAVMTFIDGGGNTEAPRVAHDASGAVGAEAQPPADGKGRSLNYIMAMANRMAEAEVKKYNRYNEDRHSRRENSLDSKYAKGAGAKAKTTNDEKATAKLIDMTTNEEQQPSEEKKRSLSEIQGNSKGKIKQGKKLKKGNNKK
jgi:hypothetical protein